MKKANIAGKQSRFAVKANPEAVKQSRLSSKSETDIAVKGCLYAKNKLWKG